MNHGSDGDDGDAAAEAAEPDVCGEAAEPVWHDDAAAVPVSRNGAEPADDGPTVDAGDAEPARSEPQRTAPPGSLRHRRK